MLTLIIVGFITCGICIFEPEVLWVHICVPGKHALQMDVILGLSYLCLLVIVQ